MIEIAIIATLIALNGLFVAAEFAIIGVPRGAIERRAAEGQRLAKIIRGVLLDPRRQDQYIATAQLGITFASLGLGMYGEHVVAGWIAGQLEVLGTGRWVAAHTAASVIAVTVLTYFHIVVGEMVPKSLALQHAERTVLAVSPPMFWVKALLYPLVIGLNGAGNGLLRLLGIRRTAGGADHAHTSEELELIVHESQEGGLLPPTTANAVRELFEFGETTAVEVMVPRVAVVGIPSDADTATLVARVRLGGHSRYPVYEGDLDHIVGVVHVKDLLRQLAAGASPTLTELHPMPYVPETATLDHVLRAMAQQRTHLAVVLDEHGGTAGMVTLEDLFEEVVGDIDEGTGRPAITREPDGRLRVRGAVHIEDVGRALGIPLEMEDVDTVGGLVLALLGRPANKGDVVTHQGVRVRVESVVGLGVQECLVERVGVEERGQ